MKKALLFLSLAGCAAREEGPDPDQPWMSLADYARLVSAGTSLPRLPVVLAPAGSDVELRIARKPSDPLGARMDALFFDALEPAEDVIALLRLKARKSVYLDLEHFRASTDKQAWIPLEMVYFPMLREADLTLRGEGVASPVKVPVWCDFQELRLARDPATGGALR